LDESFLPLAKPDISEAEIAEVLDTIRSGWLTYGPKTRRFEAEFARHVGARHAVGVSSCTAGLHLALLALGIGPGDEVITTALTFAATANVIVHVGARPVLADVCADDLNVDPSDVERRVTPRTRAIMPIDYGGHPPRLDELRDIARRHGLRIIEDAAPAAGSAYKGEPIGSLSDVTVFSFYAIKNLTTGEGGMVTTDDADVAERVAVLRNQGLDNNAWRRYSESGSPFYQLVQPGFNYRMTDIQAALGLGQLSRLVEMNARRAALAARYGELLQAVPVVEVPTVRPEVMTNWHLYVIRLREGCPPRDRVVDELRRRGIGTAVHYLPVHLHPYYRESFGYRRGDFPVAEREFERLISLPLFPAMTEADVERVVRAVEECVGG
jgi:dTDP-4-amino-4,6-dideoxygalactose transaminase